MKKMHHNYCLHLMLLVTLKLKTLSKLTNCMLTKVSHPPDGENSSWKGFNCLMMEKSKPEPPLFKNCKDLIM